VTAGSGREDSMKKLDEVLTMLERSRALGLSAEVQATIDAAILAEAGLTKRPPAAAPAVQLDIFAEKREPEPEPVEVDSRTRVRDSTSERRMFKGWTQTDPALRELIGQLRAAEGLVGGRAALAERLGLTYGVTRGYFEGYNVPTRGEADVIADILGMHPGVLVGSCHRARTSLDRLREQHGIRRAVRREIVSNPPFGKE
jgi:hypothetical protein